MDRSIPNRELKLLAGEVVEVRSQEEILATLDGKGSLEALPFMPEMLEYCGKRFRMSKRADKTCDNIKGWSLRRMKNAVHLDGLRCDGQSHGGCQAGCLIFWKEAWLKRVRTDLVKQSDLKPAEVRRNQVPTLRDGRPLGCTVADLMKASRVGSAPSAHGEEIFSCQATELRNFTSDLSPWDFRQYVRDITSGNLSRGLAQSKGERILEKMLAVVDMLSGLLIASFNRAQEWRHGAVYPFYHGNLKTTPLETLNLQPGELVQVKSKEEILQTLNRVNRNRGLLFDVEMLRYTGGIFRVLRRVEQIIDEKTGKMMRMKGDCIILDGVACRSDYHKFCPRGILHYWREIWLRRIE